MEVQDFIKQKKKLEKTEQKQKPHVCERVREKSRQPDLTTRPGTRDLDPTISPIFGHRFDRA